ncbi:hypothetical protein A2U01_0059343, partial [Trifolium medium]|nr:hypothetical protein [Trifolium medium]
MKSRRVPSLTPQSQVDEIQAETSKTSGDSSCGG